MTTPDTITSIDELQRYFRATPPSEFAFIISKSTEQQKLIKVDADGVCAPIFPHLTYLKLTFKFAFNDGNTIADFVLRFEQLQTFELCEDAQSTVPSQLIALYMKLFHDKSITETLLVSVIRSYAKSITHVSAQKENEYSVLIKNNKIIPYLVQKMGEVYRNDRGASFRVFLRAITSSFAPGNLSDDCIDDLVPMFDFIQERINNNIGNLLHSCFQHQGENNNNNDRHAEKKWALAQGISKMITAFIQKSNSLVEFMQRYGRDLLPKLSNFIFSNYDGSHSALVALSKSMVPLFQMIEDRWWTDEILIDTDEDNEDAADDEGNENDEADSEIQSENDDEGPMKLSENSRTCLNNISQYWDFKSEEENEGETDEEEIEDEENEGEENEGEENEGEENEGEENEGEENEGEENEGEENEGEENEGEEIEDEEIEGEEEHLMNMPDNGREFLNHIPFDKLEFFIKEVANVRDPSNRIAMFPNLEFFLERVSSYCTRVSKHSEYLSEVVADDVGKKLAEHNILPRFFVLIIGSWNDLMMKKSDISRPRFQALKEYTTCLLSFLDPSTVDSTDERPVSFVSVINKKFFGRADVSERMLNFVSLVCSHFKKASRRICEDKHSYAKDSEKCSAAEFEQVTLVLDKKLEFIMSFFSNLKTFLNLAEKNVLHEVNGVLSATQLNYINRIKDAEGRLADVRSEWETSWAEMMTEIKNTRE